jgi:hypothetical protein
MANNYCQSSSILPVPKGKLDKAREIVKRVIQELEDGEDDYCGCLVDVVDEGVWFHTDESINTDHVEIIARQLIDELKLDTPFFCSWAYTCSKPRIDEFGGGAFVIKRGYMTHWVDARHIAQQQAARGLKKLGRPCKRLG